VPGKLPTDAELEILDVLWKRGEATVREVHEDLGCVTGYTTVLKIMQIMAAKKLVDRDETNRSHIYRASARKERTQSSLVRDLLDKAFAGSATELLQRALQGRRTSTEELDEIRTLLDRVEKGERP
jgi:BlaI family penicillinase repressor